MLFLLIDLELAVGTDAVLVCLSDAVERGALLIGHDWLIDFK